MQGLRSKIKVIFYINKEETTYDQFQKAERQLPNQAWWFKPVIQALKRPGQKQKHCEFKTNLAHIKKNSVKKKGVGG